MKILTIDVWDTLIRRRCHPDVIKMESFSYLLKLFGQEQVVAKYLDSKLGLTLRQNIEYEIAMESKKKVGMTNTQ